MQRSKKKKVICNQERKQKQLIETDPEMKETMERVDKDFKAAIMNILKDLKKKQTLYGEKCKLLFKNPNGTSKAKKYSI